MVVRIKKGKKKNPKTKSLEKDDHKVKRKKAKIGKN